MESLKLQPIRVLVLLAVFMLAGIWDPALPGPSAKAGEDSFVVAVGTRNELLSGAGSGYNTGQWYSYPTGWHSQWFNNAPYDAGRKSVIQLRLSVEPLDQALPCRITIGYGWPTPQWYALSSTTPPLPGSASEGTYIQRHTAFQGYLPAGAKPITVEDTYEIRKCNPQWLSVEVQGENFVITDGWIKHQSMPRTASDVMLLQEQTQACCLPKGECVDADPQTCRLRGGEPQGPGTKCLGDKNNNKIDDACEEQPKQCQPTQDGQGCEKVTCPNTSDTCVPTKIRIDRNSKPPKYTVLSCACLSANLCHLAFDPPDNVYCVGGCPTGQQCELRKTDNGNGTIDYECICTTLPQPTEACCFQDGHCENLTSSECKARMGVPQGSATQCLGDKNNNGTDDACEQQPTQCAPTADGQGCLQVTCPNSGDQCVPTKIRVRYITGAPPTYTVLSCACQSPNLCHVAISSSGSVYCTGGCLSGQQCELYSTRNSDGSYDYECHCTAQPTEACCLPDGTCIDATATDCMAKGGTPQGSGTNCNTVVCPGQMKPDLAITDMWVSLEGICYEITNIGQATAPKGHNTVLLLDGEAIAADPIDVELAPGDRLRRCFDYEWFGSDVMVDDVITDTSHQANPAVAVDNRGIIHVVWEDYRDNPRLGNIYYCNSKDGGKSFEQDGMVEDAITITHHQANPAIALDNQGIIHVVWEDYRDDPKLPNIYYSNSTDGGKTFQKDVMVDDVITLTTTQVHPVIAVDDQGVIHVVWEDYRNHPALGDIYYSKSTDGGKTFEKDVMVDDAYTVTSQQRNPSIAVDKLGVIHVVWEDYRDDPQLPNIYYSKSVNGGKTFGKDVMVDDEITVTTRQVNPAIAVGKDGVIYVVFEDYRDDTNKGNIFCSRSIDGGETFEEDVMVDDPITYTSHQANPAVAVDNRGVVHIVWEDYRDNSKLANIYYSRSSDGGKTFGKDVMVDDSYTVTSQQIDPAIAVDDNGTVHVVWQDYRTSRSLANIFYSNSIGSCVLPAEHVTVCADSEDVVVESDEINNCTEETWMCDTTPPRIIAGPTVSQIGPTSCVVSWTTDEDSDSTVKYGRYAGKYESSQHNAALTQEHEVVLSDLKPATVYHYVVQSSDSNANRASSKDYTFETLPAPDEQNPQVSLVDPGICKGTAKIVALASDNLRVEKVEFYIGDKLVFMDYSAPYECMLDTNEYANGDHLLRAKAFDSSDRTGMATRVIEVRNRVPNFIGPSIEIITPDNGDTVSETVIVAARATDDEGMDRIEFYIDDEPVHARLSPSHEQESLYSSFFWDTYEVDNGTHHIRVTACDAEENFSQNTVTVTVDNIGPRHRPDMIVRRKNMTFGGTKLTIRLDVHNAGDRSASNVEIVDRLVGLQPTGWVSSGWDLTSDFDASTKECEVTLRASHAFNPGVGTDVLYDVVPILTEADILYQVGTSTSVSYDGVEADHYDKELSIPSWVVDRPGGITWHLVATVDHAFRSADYLIVTNPTRLFSHYVDDDVNVLLCSMASLAEKRAGVLGYLDTNNRTVIKGLIEPGGDWSSELAPGWTSNGYLLIVGETEIVPSRDVWDTAIRDATSGWTGGPVYPVSLSDNYYADISGSDNLPELIVARLIGDGPNQLMTPIQTSLLDQFDRTDALVVSGVGDGQDSFENNADEVVDILDDEFTVNQMYGSDYASDAQRLTQFRNRAQDKDVIYYRDHGSVNCWSHTVCDSDFPVNFGTSRPVAFGNACLTGNFEQGGDYGAAEAFLDSGAGVYIGATESSPRSPNNTAGKKFFNDWVGSSISLGQALKQAKLNLGTSTDTKRLWVLEYNLYGDPKYGMPMAASAGAVFRAQQVLAPPLSSLDVAVPDYKVTSKQGVDYVEIPDGELWLVQDMPIVPFYVVSVDYAQGYQVQDVVLRERSGLTMATGLNLPTASMAPDGVGDNDNALPPGPQWHPQKVYDWQIIENPDGSTTLRIAVYPFYYNPLTTDVQFYKNYAFDIDWVSSSVQITALATDKDVYEQQEQVQVGLWLNNSGQAQDVIVSAVVRADSSGQLVDGLLLHSLKNLQGPASFCCQWNSSGFEPGYYYVEAALQSTDGNTLDRETRRFGLGICSGQITSLSANPLLAQVGKDITINLTFSNVGTVNITGNARIKILNSSGDVLDQFDHPIADLPPTKSASFSNIWKVSQAGPCDILGYVSYDSGATEPVTIRINDAGCFPSTNSAYNDWVALGKPTCWCTPYQCDGDADGIDSGGINKYRVFTGDLNLIVTNWKKKTGDATLNPCADIDHKDSSGINKYRVFTGDLSVLVANWKKRDADLPGNCPRAE